MGIRSQRNIYSILEKHLRSATYPMTRVDLMDIQEIRDVAMEDFGGRDKDVRTTTNKLSDALGFMWRRGLLTRYPAPKETSSFARYAYVWEQKEDSRPIEPVPPSTRRSTGKKQNFTVTEEGDGIIVEGENFLIAIRIK